jgi:hypothetical protein
MMGAPLNTSLIQDADGFTILGGQFTSAAGDVTVHNHYPHVIKDTRSSLNHCSTHLSISLTSDSPASQ